MTTKLSSVFNYQVTSAHVRLERSKECPQTILKYSEYMGGVDLLDSMLGYYRINVRSKKRYLQFFPFVTYVCGK
nr:unnamed protein product [Callosobruchus analis]